MSNAKTTRVGLKVRHATPFRRTVTIGKGKDAKKVQLVFEPETPYDLDEQELAGCQDLLDGGLLVEWDEETRGKPVAPPVGRKGEEIARGNRVTELEEALAAAEDEIDQLIAQVKELGGEPCVTCEEDEDCEDECDDEEDRAAKRSIRVDDLEISEGTRAALRDAGLTTVKKIEAHRKSNDGAFDVPGIGDAKAQEIDEAIAKAK